MWDFLCSIHKQMHFVTNKCIMWREWWVLLVHTGTLILCLRSIAHILFIGCISSTFLSAFPQVLFHIIYVLVWAWALHCFHVQLYYTSFCSCIFFSFSVERAQVLLHKFIRSFRCFFFICSVLCDLIFAFLSLGFFPPFPSFIRHIRTYTCTLCTGTHRCYAKKKLVSGWCCDTRKKQHHLQMLTKNVSIYWNLDTKNISNERKKSIFLYTSNKFNSFYLFNYIFSL